MTLHSEQCNDCEHDHDNDESMVKESTYVRSTPKVGRNEPCPCGSGKKYKKCCIE